jgi:hypothetical protein
MEDMIPANKTQSAIYLEEVEDSAFWLYRVNPMV